MEAVLPVELEIPSLRVFMESQIGEVDWIKTRYTELALLDETRLKASYIIKVIRSVSQEHSTKRSDQEALLWEI